MLGNIKKFQLVICGYNLVYGNKEEKIVYSQKEQELKREEIIFLYEKNLLNSLWNKIFLSKIIKENNITFPEKISKGEDLLFVLEYISHMDGNIFISPRNLYNYEMKPSGLNLKRGDSLDEKIERTNLIYQAFMKISTKEKKRIGMNILDMYNRHIKHYIKINKIINVVKIRSIFKELSENKVFKEILEDNYQNDLEINILKKLYEEEKIIRLLEKNTKILKKLKRKGKNMKKIGIVTFHRPYNYGANLQAFALQKKIEQMNYDVKLIDYRNKQIEKETKLIYKGFKGKNIKMILKEILVNILFFNKNIIRKMNFKKFQKKYYKLSQKYKAPRDIENSNEQFNTYLSGSDQIWNSNITKGIDPVYTLNLKLKNIKRVSYASSMGDRKVPSEDEIKELIGNLQKYDKLSVREKSGCEFLKKYITKDIDVVLDPTLLLEKEEWEKIGTTKHEKEEYILFYTIRECDEIFEIANKLSQITNLKIITFRRTNGKLKNVIKNYYTKGPDEFIRAFKNAKYIVTSSFHGTVFSIIFNKPFFVNYCGKENKRVENLLEILNLKERVIEKESDLTRESIEKSLNFAKINERLRLEREKSLRYLEGALKDE